MAWHVMKMVWWLLLAMVPFVVGRLASQVLVQLGCPPGDCYLPGAGPALDLVTLNFFCYLFILPVCAWHFAGLSWQLVRTIRDQRQLSER